jgi:hypothetical protein
MIAKDLYWLCLRLLVAAGLTLLAITLRASEPPIPIVHILATDPCGAEENQDNATFTIFREGPTNTSLTVQYQVGGTASNGLDFQMLSGSATIPAGARRAPVIVRPVDDRLVEGTEIVLVSVLQPLVWPPPYIVCWPSLAFAHIEDNDFPPTNQPPVVRIASPPDGTVFVAPVDVTICAQASDRDGRVITVEFFAGTNSLGIVSNYPVFTPIPIAEDDDALTSLSDADLYPDFNMNGDAIAPTILRPFHLTWHDVPPGEHTLTALATDNFGESTRSEPVTIKVTEPPVQPIVTVTAPDPMAAEPDPTSARLDTATFRVHRSGATELPLTVYYRLSGTASNGLDYEELAHSVTIPRGARTADVIVEPIDDNLAEGTESVVISIIPPICIAIWPPPPDCYVVGGPHAARAAIHDNDIAPGNLPPLVEIVRPLDGSIFRAPANIALVAQARDLDGRVVTVEFFEGTNSLGVVTNDPGVITASRPPFFLVWSNVPQGRYVLTAQATDDDGATGRSRPVEIKVVDLIPPPVVTITATDPDAAEGAMLTGGDTAVVNPATLVVNRTGGTGQPLLVYYSLAGTAANGVDYRRLSGEVTIPTGASSAPVHVIPIDDNLCEGTETVVVNLELGAWDLEFSYVVGDPRQARATIRDNDVCPANIPPRVAIMRPENGEIFTAPADIVIYAAASDPDGRVVSVEFFANGKSLGVVSNATSNIDQLFRLAWNNVEAGGYRLTARATDNGGAVTTSDPVDIKVIEFFRLPIVTIEAADPYASEGPRPFLTAGVAPWAEIIDVAAFVVKRDRGTNHPLVVHYAVGGTASNGVDYESLRGRVEIPEGAWSARVVVQPLDDDLIEGTETVVLSLEPIACPRVIPPPPECYIVGEPSRAIAFIRDNDSSNALPKVEIVEPANGQIFAAPADIEINVTTRDSDGWVQTVQFFEGTNKIGEASIHFIQPPPPGQVQKFSMIWSNVPAGRYVLSAKAIDDRGGSSRSEPVEIKVLDPCRLPVVTIEAIDPFAAEQDPRIDALPDPATLRVKRTCVANTPLTVFLEISGTASNGVDYQLLREHVTIPEGAASADIVIEAIDDLLVEGLETVGVRIEPPVCLATDPPPPGCYVVGVPSRAVAYIRDNDAPANVPPQVALVNPPDDSVFEAPADILLVARASDLDGWVHTVEFFEGTNSLGIVTNNPLVLDPVRNASPGFDSEPFSPINPFQLRWQDVPPGNYVLSAVATDNRGAATKSEPVEIKVVERPEPPIVTVIARDPIGSEGPIDPTAERAPDNAIFTVKRSGPTNVALTVFYRLSGTASNGVDYRELPNTVVIPVGARTADVIVQPIDDNLVEGLETVVISLVEPICIDIFPLPLDCYLVGRDRAARAVIYDNDALANEPPQVRLLQPEDGSVFLAPADIRLIAQAFDRDGEVKQVEFFEGTNSLGVVTDPLPNVDSIYPLYSLGWSNVPPGHYVLSAVATDDDGLSTPSEPVEIKVVERVPPPVVTITAPDPEASGQDPRSAEPRVDNATFTVHRTGPTNAPLTVFYRVGGSASNAVDYEFLRGHVTIPAGAPTADILVQPIDDLRCEGDESVVLSLLPPVCVAIFPPVPDCYVIGDPNRARAVIHDNDLCPSNQPPKVAIIRPQNGDVFVAPADIRVCAEAKDVDGRIVRVDFYANNNPIGSAIPGTSNTEEIFCIAWTNVRGGDYALTAVATDNGGASTRSDPVRIRVLDQAERPVVTIRATDSVASEPTPGIPEDLARFTVTRSCCTNEALVVYFTLGGSAQNGLDYSFVRDHVTIPAGASSASVVIEPPDDNLVEGTETVVATLQSPPCIAVGPPPSDCYIVGYPPRAIAYIRDNDSGPNLPPQVAIVNPPEGATFVGPAKIEITAVARDPDGWVPLVEFFEGKNKIGESEIVFIQEPPPGELQVFTFDWLNVPPGRYVLTARATDNLGSMTVSGPIHVTVLDECTVPVVTVHAPDPFANEGGDTATFVVRRSCALENPLFVQYTISGTAENGLDYWRLSGEILFPAGEDAAPIVIHPVDDSLVEGTETIVITLIQPRCLNTDPTTPGCYLVGSLAGRARAYLRDNDDPLNLPPRVAIVRPRAGSIFHVPEDILITAKTRDPDGWVTTMQFFEGTNELAGLAILVAELPPPGEVQTFNFTWHGARPGHYVLRAKATDNDGASTWSGPVEITVVDSNQPPVVTIYAPDCYAVEGANPPNTAAFVVRRSGPTNAPLTVHYAIGGTASNGVDYAEIPSSVTIPAGRRGARIVITPVDDRALERVETVILSLYEAALYNVGRPGRAAAIIVDNDYRPPLALCFPDRVFSLSVANPYLSDDTQTSLAPFSYRLEATTNFDQWTIVDYNTCVEGSVHFVDADASEHNMRFYRVMEDFEYPEDE